MEVALIAPVDCLQKLPLGNFHLTLAHWALESEVYLDFYRGQADAGAYVILDNGAHEKGTADQVDDLQRVIDLMHPQEAVLCDTKNNMDATIRGTISSYKVLSQHYPEMNYMIVPHGQNFGEWLECLSVLLREIPNPVVGIPRCQGDLYGTLLPHMQSIAILGDDAPQVHLLGNPTNWRVTVKTVREFAEDMVGTKYPLLRSVDSAKPISYALKGHPMDLDAELNLGRPDNFLNCELPAKYESLAHFNIAYYLYQMGSSSSEYYEVESKYRDRTLKGAENDL